MAAHNEPCRAVGVSWLLNHWEDGVRRHPSPSAELAVTWVRGPAHPREKPPATSFNVLPSPCGEVTQACGSTVCPPPLPGLTETLEFLFSTLHFVFFICSFLSHPLQVITFFWFAFFWLFCCYCFGLFCFVVILFLFLLLLFCFCFSVLLWFFLFFFLVPVALAGTIAFQKKGMHAWCMHWYVMKHAHST